MSASHDSHLPRLHLPPNAYLAWNQFAEAGRMEK